MTLLKGQLFLVNASHITQYTFFVILTIKTLTKHKLTISFILVQPAPGHVRLQVCTIPLDHKQLSQFTLHSKMVSLIVYWLFIDHEVAFSDKNA